MSALHTLTLLMTTLDAFQLRSFGMRPPGASSTKTAADTFDTMAGGLGNVRNSVRFSYTQTHTHINTITLDKTNQFCSSKQRIWIVIVRVRTVQYRTQNSTR